MAGSGVTDYFTEDESHLIGVAFENAIEANAKKPKRARTKPNSDTWKSFESFIGRFLTALHGRAKPSRRVPVTGRTRGDAPDVDDPVFAIEAKHGRQIPKLLLTAMAQADAAAAFYLKRDEGERIPMVVMHPHGGRNEESLVIFRIKDLPRIIRLGATE